MLIDVGHAQPPERERHPAPQQSQATSPDHLSLSSGVARLIPEFLLGVLVCRLRQAMPEHDGFALGAVLSLIVCAAGAGLGLDTLFVAGAAGLVFSLSYGKDVLTRQSDGELQWRYCRQVFSFGVVVCERAPHMELRQSRPVPNDQCAEAFNGPNALVLGGIAFAEA